MTFRFKLIVALVVVGMLPVIATGWLSFNASTSEMVHLVGVAQAERAAEIARRAEQTVLDGVRSLQLALQYIPVAELEPHELHTILAIPYQQIPEINALVVLDAQGTALVSPVFESTDATAAGREVMSEEDLGSFAGHTPLESALEHGVAIGPPYRGASTGRSRLAVALRTHGAPPRVIAAELSLAEVEVALASLCGAGGSALLVDSTGQAAVACGDEELATVAQADLIQPGLQAGQPITSIIEHAGHPTWLTAFAPVGQLGWGVVAAEPASTAFSVPNRVRRYTLFWSGVALLLTAALGLLIARGFTGPMRVLSEGARSLTRGAYNQRVAIETKDELGEFARAFNHMAAEIQSRDHEIRRWNLELQNRVAQRTDELKAAQDQILRNRKLTALGSISAGLVHELNNPLTGLLGFITLSRLKLPDDSPVHEMLESANEQAQRVATIITEFQTFADQEREAGAERFAAVMPVKRSLRGLSQRLNQNRIRVLLRFEGRVPSVQGSSTQLQEMVTHLLQNAIDAMPDGGALTVTLSSRAPEVVRLAVRDTGSGIPMEHQDRIFDPFFSTKSPGHQVGLGLSVVHNVVNSHHGKLSVESRPDEGTTFTVILPAAPAAPHLV